LKLSVQQTLPRDRITALARQGTRRPPRVREADIATDRLMPAPSHRGCNDFLVNKMAQSCENILFSTVKKRNLIPGDTSRMNEQNQVIKSPCAESINVNLFHVHPT
jgi:hypothetical protein